MKVLRLQPGAEPGIVDFRLALPEVGFETALNAEMTELQFDVLRSFGKVATDVVCADMQSRHAMTFALRLNHHRKYLLFKSVEGLSETMSKTETPVLRFSHPFDQL